MNHTRACIHRNFGPAVLLFWAVVFVLGRLIEGTPHDQVQPSAIPAPNVQQQ
jgi:hypothetical protein